MKTLFLITLPTVILADIKIEVKSENQSERTINYYGSNLNLISDTERTTFNLTDENLKKCVENYFGSRPDDVFLNNPTPWGDLYTSHNWKPVTRSLIPHHARIVSFSSTPMLVLTQIFNNTSWQKAKFKTAMRRIVNNTITSTWDTGIPLTVDEDVQYRFNMTAASFKGRLLATYASKWGKSVSISENVVAGSKTPVYVTLEPKQTIVADLVALKDVIRVKVDYIATVFGSTVANYGDQFNGHHFWAIDINLVMEAAGKRLSFVSSEVIDLNYFTDAKVIVRDFFTRDVLDTLNFKIYRA